MHPLEMPRRRLRMLAAVTGIGAMAALGALTVVDAATPGAESVATKFSSTTTVKAPPTAPEISFASPAVKAPHK